MPGRFVLTEEMLSDLPYQSLAVILMYLDDLVNSDDVRLLNEMNRAAGTRLRQHVRYLKEAVKRFEQEVREEERDVLSAIRGLQDTLFEVECAVRESTKSLTKVARPSRKDDDSEKTLYDAVNEADMEIRHLMKMAGASPEGCIEEEPDDESECYE
jgi:hypothetical protein